MVRDWFRFFEISLIAGLQSRMSLRVFFFHHEALIRSKSCFTGANRLLSNSLLECEHYRIYSVFAFEGDQLLCRLS